VATATAIQGIVRTIVRETGSSSHPVVVSADPSVRHAMAELDEAASGGGSAPAVARVKYNAGFLAEMERATGTSWSVWGILLHEVGHHARDHTGARKHENRHLAQLEADEFAGFWLARFGAPLDEAVAVFEVIEDRFAPPPPHPRRRAVRLVRPERGDRVASVIRGWHAGQRESAESRAPKTADSPRLVS
jgi:hypothetical protein